MHSDNAILIDELPPGSKLYYLDNGQVVIAGESPSGSPWLYEIRSGMEMRNPSCQLRHMVAGSAKFVDVAYRKRKEGITGCAKDRKPVAILSTLFPTAKTNRQSLPEDISDDMRWELLACLENHPAIQAWNHPLQHIALLFWTENGETLLNRIEQEGGRITTAHLCQALEIPRLTTAMKQFIRLVEPHALVSGSEHLDLVKNILQHWYRYRRVFQNCQDITMPAPELRDLHELLQAYPALLQAKWFGVRNYRLHGKNIPPVSWIRPAYDHYLCQRRNQDKAGAIPALSLDDFLTGYIRDARQLCNLIHDAFEEIENEAGDWLKSTYPDEYRFDNLPGFADNHVFRLIRTAGQLREAAGKLRNCAPSYLHEAATGEIIFFSYEYTPGVIKYWHTPDSPTEPVSGLLALRREALANWQSLTDWNDLVVDFTGYRNAELGEQAWRDLEGLLHLSF